MQASPKDKTIDVISLILTLCFLILIIVFICVKIVPQIVESVKSVVAMIQIKWPQWAAILKSYNIDTTPVTDWLENLKFESVLTKFMSGAGLIIDKVAGTAASTISVVTTVAISLVVMFYILISRKDLERQCTKALYAYLKKEVADRIVYIACLIRSTYTKFFVRTVCGSLHPWISDVYCVSDLPYSVCGTGCHAHRHLFFYPLCRSLLLLRHRCASDFDSGSRKSDYVPGRISGCTVY